MNTLTQHCESLQVICKIGKLCISQDDILCANSDVSKSIRVSKRVQPLLNEPLVNRTIPNVYLTLYSPIAEAISVKSCIQYCLLVVEKGLFLYFLVQSIVLLQYLCPLDFFVIKCSCFILKGCGIQQQSIARKKDYNLFQKSYDPCGPKHHSCL